MACRVLFKIYYLFLPASLLYDNIEIDANEGIILTLWFIKDNRMTLKNKIPNQMNMN